LLYKKNEEVSVAYWGEQKKTPNSPGVSNSWPRRKGHVAAISVVITGVTLQVVNNRSGGLNREKKQKLGMVTGGKYKSFWGGQVKPN